MSRTAAYVRQTVVPSSLLLPYAHVGFSIATKPSYSREFFNRILCKRPFPEFVAKIRIQRQRSSADIYRSSEQNCNRPAAFKNATVRERPEADVELVWSVRSNSLLELRAVPADAAAIRHDERVDVVMEAA